MRLWSVHPAQLDRIALVAVWREGLLAKKVLQGKTKGYTKHPQLDRFKCTSDPETYINAYLAEIANEAENRGYSFDRSKIDTVIPVHKLTVTRGQLEYEWQHLLQKSAVRSPDHHALLHQMEPLSHPLFDTVPGGVEPWERPAA